MKVLFALLLPTLLLASVSGSSQSKPSLPVVVELFTSEGCSSCPPADALLIELSKNPPGNIPEVIVLGEHVDYWNDTGWIDRFSSSAFTQRQNDYVNRFHLASAYTPQMVIDGRAQVAGNDRSGVYRSIEEAASQRRLAQINIRWEAGDTLHVAVQLRNALKAKVLLAISEDGLTTSVRDGENRGRTLRHVGVARGLWVLGTVTNGGFETAVEAPRGTDWNSNNLKVVVFVQEPNNGPILGAASIAYPR